MPERSSPDHRQFTRVGPAMEVNLHLPGSRTRYGVLRDISLGGFFVEISTEHMEPVPCRAEILLDGVRRISLHGRITRMETEGLAVEILYVDDLESNQHLVNLVSYNSNDAGKIECELPSRGARAANLPAPSNRRLNG